jgi:autophagy-related protein 9
MMDQALPRTSLRDGSTPRIRDLGLLYSNLYDFWLHRGAWNATVNQLVTLLNCIALWIFAFAMFFMLDWDLIIGCEGEQCAKRPLFHSPAISGNMSTGHTLLAVCFLLACAGSVLWELRCFIETAHIMNELHSELRHHIRVGDRSPLHSLYFTARKSFHGRQGHALIPDVSDDRFATGDTVEHVGNVFQSIEDISWNDFVHTVIRRILRKDQGISNRQTLDELRVVQTMSVVENYLVALHAHHFFRRGSVLWWASEFVVRGLVKAQFDQGRLRQPEEAVLATKQQLFRAFIASVALYPLVTSFFLAKTLIRHVAVARSNPRYLVEYEWTPEAYWTFRLYNELPHLYEARLRCALDEFQRVMDETEPPAVFLRFPHRVAEIAILLMAVIGLVNAGVVTVGHFWSRAVVWWLWLALVVYGTTVTTQRHREVTHRTDAYLAGVRRLYYEDASWRQQTSSFRGNMVRHFLWPRVVVVLREFAAVLLLPAMLLWLYLRGEDELRSMAKFLQEQSVYVDGVGHVCALAAFDTDPNGKGGDDDPSLGPERSPTLPPTSSGFQASPDSDGSDSERAPHEALDSGSSGEEMRPMANNKQPQHQRQLSNSKRGGEEPMRPAYASAAANNSFMSREVSDPAVTVIPMSDSNIAPDGNGFFVGKPASPHVGSGGGVGHDGFIGAIDADFVPRSVTLRKRAVSLVHFAAIHTHWAESASVNGRSEEVRSVASFVTKGQEALATATATTMLPVASPTGTMSTSAHSFLFDTAARRSAATTGASLAPHEVAHWQTSRFFAPVAVGSERQKTADERTP